MTMMQAPLLRANRVLLDRFSRLLEQLTAFRVQSVDINTCKAPMSAPRALQACSYSMLVATLWLCVKIAHMADTLSSLERAISQIV